MIGLKFDILAEVLSVAVERAAASEGYTRFDKAVDGSIRIWSCRGSEEAVSLLPYWTNTESPVAQSSWVSGNTLTRLLVMMTDADMPFVTIDVLDDGTLRIVGVAKRSGMVEFTAPTRVAMRALMVTTG